ncbi:hypothetical protein HMPREF9372_3795 [Sporosarcina newyorkensis 2681]|uniref:Uncharacterized protein n=1 Tax=Sporosarcina newyorkensis 2681 TaxID=1027292 RepID=F9DYB4_9BACL|nr:hypothetical protein HMPREF9372_3795 [Sporosarcina newyorkensis 2681]
MKFFRSMNKKESQNWRNGAVLGFDTYMLMLFVNYLYYLSMKKDFFSSHLIFWSGLLVAFGYDVFLSHKDKRQSGYKSPSN